MAPLALKPCPFKTISARTNLDKPAHPAGLSNLIPAEESIVSEQCRAFCGTVENSPVVKPRVNVVPKSSPASSRTAELPFPSEIKSSPQTTRDSNTKCAKPKFHSELLSTLPQKARHSSGKADLDKLACCVSTRPRASTSFVDSKNLHHGADLSQMPQRVLCSRRLSRLQIRIKDVLPRMPLHRSRLDFAQ